MTNMVYLKKILNNTELCSTLNNLIRSNKGSILIEDIDHTILLGQCEENDSPEYPVIVKEKTIGWVKGPEPAESLAQLLTYIANQELLVSFDELTGIPNRRAFNQYFTQELKRAKREIIPLSLLMSDLDYFKDYNDYYGHIFGDHCLKQVAEKLHEVLKRPGDFVARYGGEEFVILLPNTSQEGAKKIAQDVCNAVRELYLSHPLSKVSHYVTISIGVTTMLPGQKTSPLELCSKADVALYHAKAQGRNSYYFQL